MSQQQSALDAIWALAAQGLVQSTRLVNVIARYGSAPLFNGLASGMESIGKHDTARTFRWIAEECSKGIDPDLIYT